MLKEFVEKLIEVSKIEVMEIAGMPFARQKLVPIRDYAHPVKMHTLQGLVDYINISMIEDPIIVIDSPDVVFVSKKDHVWNEYMVVAESHRFGSSTPFEFGRKYSIEEFIIKLYADFAQTPDRDEVIVLVSKLTSGVTHLSEDDGISQVVTVKSGVSLRGEKKINPRVLLSPYRTFHEVEQPSSYYILRVYQQEDEAPQVALHEAEGGRWRETAVNNIKKYLKENVDIIDLKITVIA